MKISNAVLLQLKFFDSFGLATTDGISITKLGVIWTWPFAKLHLNCKVKKNHYDWSSCWWGHYCSLISRLAEADILCLDSIRHNYDSQPTQKSHFCHSFILCLFLILLFSGFSVLQLPSLTQTSRIDDSFLLSSSQNQNRAEEKVASFKIAMASGAIHSGGPRARCSSSPSSQTSLTVFETPNGPLDFWNGSFCASI